MLSFDSFAPLPHFISYTLVTSSASVSCICYGSGHISNVEVRSQLCSEIPERERSKVLKSEESELTDMWAQLILISSERH